jgi:anti-sigma factor RsiW
VTCREHDDLVLDYLARDLPPLACERFERHLFGCMSCQRRFVEYERSLDLVKRAFDDEDLTAVPDELVRSILLGRQLTPGVGIKDA